nr:MAG TPA: Cytochrome c oxidase subunit 1 [Caudoviricetes sp.]
MRRKTRAWVTCKKILWVACAFCFGKIREVQRFLYYSRPEEMGPKERMTEIGIDQTCPQGNGH